MTADARGQRATEFVLFGVTFLTFAYFYQASDHSTAARFDLIRSTLERGTMWIDGFCGYNTADIINFRGHYYSVKAPGASLTALLPWMLWEKVLSLFSFRNESFYWAAITYFTIVFSTSLVIALTSIVMFRFARWLGAGQG